VAKSLRKCELSSCSAKMASSGMFRCFFIGHNRPRLSWPMNAQRPVPFQTPGNSRIFPMRRGVRLQIKRAGGRAPSLSSRPPAVERRRPPTFPGFCPVSPPNMFIFSHIKNTGKFRKNRLIPLGRLPLKLVRLAEAPGISLHVKTSWLGQGGKGRDVAGCQLAPCGRVLTPLRNMQSAATTTRVQSTRGCVQPTQAPACSNSVVVPQNGLKMASKWP
jgi:hypothetical protein